MDLNENEKAIFKKAMDMMIKKVKKIADEEADLIEDGKFAILLESCYKLANKIMDHISGNNEVAKEVYVTKITFFTRDRSEFGSSTSVRFPRAKHMLCTIYNLCSEINNLNVTKKSGMIMYEYFLSAEDYQIWINSDDEDMGPIIDYIFTE